MEVKNEFVRIPLSKLVKAPWNYKHDDADLMAKLVENIRQNGELQNIVVRELGDGTYEIVNGNHRFDAYKTLGMTDAACKNVGKVSDARARRIALELNQTSFPHDAVKMSSLVGEIAVEVPVLDLEKTMPYSGQEIQNMIDSLKFDWTENKKPSSGKAPDMHTVKMTKDQWNLIEQAVSRIKELEQDSSMSDGRCLELICADFLAGAGSVGGGE